ncbi:MAG: hypothetical protein J5874_06345 [Oscillospiraceae bacterium]|nr:hypothetical protein [Oscillospiraceae bacterium]
MYRYKLELVTTKDIMDFVNSVTGIKGAVKLVDESGFCVNGKSLLGAMASVEWNELYCVSDEDIYARISKFCKE